MDLIVLPTFKTVAAWFPGTMEDPERCFSRIRRLNRGLDTGQWRVYECRKEPNGVRLVLIIDSASVTVLDGPTLESLQRRGTSYFLPSGRQARRVEIRRPVEVEDGKKEA